MRLTLIGAGLSHQRTRSWKWSPDPHFQTKAERVLGLYRQTEDGVVVCFDEMGPIQLIPHQRSGWGQLKAPRAVARDLQQERRGALPVRRLRRAHRPAARPAAPPQERAIEVLGFYRQIRIRYKPKQRIYLIADTSPRTRPPRSANGRKTTTSSSCSPPTYASFLNRIECHFWAIGEFVVNNADYPDWNTFKKAMADHIQYRNGPHRDQRLLKAERRLLIAA